MKRWPVILLLALPAVAFADDAQLRSYIEQALRDNPALAARHENVRASDYDLAEARAQQYPQLSFNARYTRAHGGRTIDIPTGAMLNPVYDTLNRMLEQQGQPPQFPNISDQSIALLREREQETKLSLSAPLVAPQLWAQVDARQALAGASRAQREGYARNLVRELKRAYYASVQAQALSGILEASERLLAENVRVAQALLDAGKATRDRVLRAEAERLAAAQQLDAARTRARQAQRLVNLLRGSEPDAPLELPTPDTLELPAGPKVETRPRPELRELDANLAASEASERAARAANWPTLGLAADYGIQGEEYRFNRDDDFDTISLVLRWDLWDSGARSAQRRRATAQRAALSAEREDLQRRLTLALRAAEEDLATALRAVESSQAQLAAAEESFRIAERKRDAAALSQIEFLDAERAQREARMNLAIARCEALDRAAEYELATAGYPLPEALLAP